MKGDFKEVTYGYCKCGCGEKTKVSPQNDAFHGYIKGEAREYCPHHHTKSQSGRNNYNWKGGKKIVGVENFKYVRILLPEHPRSDHQGHVLEHIYIVEDALGWPLPEDAVVHHIDKDGTNNKMSNLMVFKNNAEHLKFHARLKNGL